MPSSPLSREAPGLTLAIESQDELAYTVTAYCTESSVVILARRADGQPVHQYCVEVESPVIRREHPEHTRATLAGAVAA